MKHLFKPEVTKWFWSLLILLLVVKMAWFTVELLWLPTMGVEHSEKRGPKALYYRVKLSPNDAAAPTTRRPVQTAGRIQDIKLLAVYNASDVTVVTVEYKRTTKVLAKGEAINGFVLEGAGSNYATFSKDAKTYQINLIVSRKGEGSIKSAQPSAASASTANQVEGEVIDAGDHKIVDRSLLDHYAKNMDDIYKNIGIREIKKGKVLEGFSISFIRKGSPFAKLGIQRGDVIKSINGQKIDSYNAAFDVYKNIANIDNLTLVIQRGKEEMELEYEVN
ncbi:PDZ domain-containing protein [Sulfurovum sp. XGS-02]|uniref:PDZ domain-containing protein n=1 Tax=Sulfurovum sp. XGS-02 TaxID=2925411 RepID=UPI002062CDEC|nr:PDZ domain-containing protein [Sulfurovum sp. XGS-02]UPT77583.1 PDZ domain-containing protein [Sulfurovum sp. XGS-02]